MISAIPVKKRLGSIWASHGCVLTAFACRRSPPREQRSVKQCSAKPHSIEKLMYRQYLNVSRVTLKGDRCHREY